MPLGASFFEDVPLVEFMYLVFTHMPGGVTVGDSGLCCCVPCLSSAITSFPGFTPTSGMNFRRVNVLGTLPTHTDLTYTEPHRVCFKVTKK